MTTEPGSGTPMPSPHEPAAAEPTAGGAGPGSELIQSMLSRAADEQVSQQREMTSALSDIRGQLMRLGQELAEMRVRPTDDASDAQINTVTVEMREAVRFLSERLDGVTRMVAQRGEELADVRTALTAIDAHVRSQAETIAVLSSGLQALPSYGERVSVLQDNLQVLHRQLTGVEQTLSNPPEDNSAEVVERLTAIEQTLSNPPEDNSAEVAERLTAIEQAVANRGEDNSPELVERLTALESALTPVLERIDEMDADGGEAQAAVVSQIQAAAAQLQEAIVGVHNRIDPIADDVTAIGSEVTGLVEGAADGALLDSRITQSVNEAVRLTEQRLNEHVDEAVLALAETLLKHRSASGGVPFPVPVDDGENDVEVDEYDAEIEADELEFEDEPDLDEADELGPVAADEVDLDEVEDDDTADDETADGDLEPPVGATTTRAWWDNPSTAADEDEPVADDVADDDQPVEDDVSDDADLTPAIAYSDETTEFSDTWSKPTPSERAATPPLGEVETGKRKRRWGRRNR